VAAETFLASFGLIGLRLGELHGIDPNRFAEQVGLASIDLPDTKTRLPSSLLDRAFAKAAELIPDPAFALRAAECWHPSHLGALGYAWLSSDSLRTALRRMTRFNQIIGQRMFSRCADEPDGLRFTYDHGRGDTPVGHLMADFDLSIVMSMCRTNYGADLAPIVVTLRRPTPVDPSPYPAFFACPIQFGATCDTILLSRHAADKLLPTSNRELAATFDAILTKQLLELGRGNLVARCATWLLQELTSGEPSEAELARALGMSNRTLQRKLGELGQSYRGILEKTRYELALRYLEDAGKTVTDITFLLGFSEQSAFTRAFKRWSGKSPTSYREVHLNQA